MPTTNELGVFIQEQRPVVSSRDVARVFEKEHANVLKSIRALEIPENFAAVNFNAGSYKDSQNQERPEYLMTKDGFTLLAMGFTGKKAMEFKIRYIQTFNVMEAELEARELAEMEKAEPESIDFKTASFILEGARVFRDVISPSVRKKLAQKYLALVGINTEIISELPDTFDDMPGFVRDVQRFVDEVCVPVSGSWCSRERFYERYKEWAHDNDACMGSRCMVARAVNRLGLFHIIKRGNLRGWEGVLLG